MDNKVTNPKMFNTSKFLEGYESIDWGRNKEIYCFDCGLRISKENLDEHPKLYDTFEDGDVRHKNGCNYN